AMEAGAQAAEIYHTLIMLASTIGFPTVVAALTWADDVIQGKK
ncbi:MAG: carboxymuconolactone decarboxylase family protein, partial [Burkholderiales bacterium]|nr:carboxymuconolactone decarboxylase family protein [Burkholderiales bacterium]